MKKFKERCVRDFQNIINIKSVVMHGCDIVISYTMHEEEHSVTLRNDKETAEFLKRHELIWDYRMKDGEVRMFTLTQFNVTVNAGAAARYDRETPYRFEDIDLTDASCIHYAALHEFDKSTAMHKVVSMVSYISPYEGLKRLRMMI